MSAGRIARIAEMLPRDWQSRASYQTLSGELAPSDLEEACRARGGRESG